MLNRMLLLLFWSKTLHCLSLPKPDCTGVNALNPSCLSNETPYKRDFFYVGGRYILTSTGNVTVDQVYVEKLSPIGTARQPHPLVFFHGGATSAVTWLNTPDNRFVSLL